MLEIAIVSAFVSICALFAYHYYKFWKEVIANE